MREVDVIRESASEIADLEKLIYDNPELERLEAVLDDFNPFEAMRWTRQEVRHSGFLRWILDPSETHGLGPYFLKALAKRLARRATDTPGCTPTVIDIDGLSFARTEVLQEWNNIDLLVRDDDERFLMVIENKVDSGEHSNQLQRYRSVVEERYPGYAVLYGFLSVGGVAPSDENYASLDYSEIATLVSETATRRQDQLGNEVRSFLLQYAQMVRRNIVEESEVQQLCRSIYANHKRALDMIFEHRPDKMLEVTEHLKAQVAKRSGLEFDHSAKSFVCFIPTELDCFPRIAERWTPSKRLLLFFLENYANKVVFRISIGPGPHETRLGIQAAVAEHPGAFNRARTKLGQQVWSFHSEVLVGVRRYEELDSKAVGGMAFHKLDQRLKELTPKVLEVLGAFREEGVRHSGLTKLVE